MPSQEGLVTCVYEPTLTLSWLARRVQKQCAVAGDVAFEAMDGTRLGGKTLADAGVKPGDSVRAVL